MKSKINHPEALKFMNHEFDFNNQHKKSCSGWLERFTDVFNQYKGSRCFIGLSSGYDSGAVANELKKVGVKFKAFTIDNNENKLILGRRIKTVGNHELVEGADWFDKYKEILRERLDNADYTIKYNGKIRKQTILDDDASVALAYMCDTARKQGWDTYISTQGADEVLSDYGLWTAQSTYNGVFPDDLKEWYNFKDGCNYSYLLKETRVPAVFGVKVRFPFLDIKLVQEFLWLTASVKNGHYKAPLYQYLVQNGVPFECGIKRGFSPC